MRDTQTNTNQPPPNQVEEHSPSLARAWRLRGQSLWKKAADICYWHLSHNHQCGKAWHLLGILAYDQGDPSQAVNHLKKAITVEPLQPAHYNNLGFVLNSMGRYAQSETCLRKALDVAPDFHDAHCNLGLSLYHQNHLSRAAKCFEEILDAVPYHDAALANLGMARLAQQMYAEAANAYEKAVAISPDQPQWHGNLGAAYIRMGQYDKAAECYRRASELDTATLDYDIHRSIARRAAGDLSESIRLLEKVLSKDPSRSSALAHLVVGLEYTCQWDKLDLFHPLLDQATLCALDDGRRPHEDPMLNIRRCDDPSINQAVGRAWSRHLQNRARTTGIRLIHSPASRNRQKITLGYLSYDFRNHPVAHQLFPLFGMHDRNRFHTIAFSMGPDDGSFFRRKILAGCDDFVDVGTLGLAEAARTIYDRQIDILVDLMGHSHHNRMEILALRPAPIQVGYLGFLSTTGAQFIDYLVTDAKVVPKNHEPYFNEKLLRMPHCYQFSHAGLIGGETDTRREDWGLPDTGFVFCCFNTVYKIDRELFDTWMRILQRVPGSVLWLNGGHQMARQHMRSRARMLGIDSDRLVFCEKIGLEDHLKRIPLADLALDTIRYNGGATTANAIAAGVPVLTVMGRHWVSRMSASQLIAAGLPDLVFPSIFSYEHAAIELALNENKLQSVRQRLKENFKSHPLFDCQGFVRQLEAGFEIIWQRFLDGLRPDHVDIPEAPLGTGSLLSQKHDLRSAENVAQAPRTYNAHGQSVQQNNRNCRYETTLKLANTSAIGNDPGTETQHTIYYYCPASQSSSAGIRRLYRHVSLLHDAGFPAYLLIEKQGYHHPEMPSVPVAYLDHVGKDKTAIFVIPEGMPRIMHRLKDHPGRRFVIALSWCYVYSTLPDGLDWRHMNIERVLVVSPAIGHMIKWSMGLPIHQLASSIDHRLYYYIPAEKQKQITFIKRKTEQVHQLQSLLASRNSDYINKIKWVGLDGLSQQDYAAQIRRSAIFLSTSMAEGFPTSCLEAMAAGTIVCGYNAVGGREILCADGRDQNSIMSSNGDYVSLAYRMAPLLDDLIEHRMDRWHPIISRARQTSLKYTAHSEAASLIDFWKPFVYGQMAGRQDCATASLSRLPIRPTPAARDEYIQTSEH